MWPSSTRVGRILDGLRNSFNRSSAMWPSSTWHSSLPPITPLRFQSLKRDVAFFHSPAGIYLHRYPGCFNRSSAMWPSSTHKSSPAAVKHTQVSIAQARCGLLPQVHMPYHMEDQQCFNRSSAMWPSSTVAPTKANTGEPMFQSLKRDVAFFHATAPAKVRGVAPFQSLKRDVAFFHFVGWIARVVASLVSIAQARCGLLPRPTGGWAWELALWSFLREGIPQQHYNMPAKSLSILHYVFLRLNGRARGYAQAQHISASRTV